MKVRRQCGGGGRCSVLRPAGGLLGSPGGEEVGRAGHHHRVVPHLQGEHPQLLPDAVKDVLLQVAELAAPPGPLGLQLLASSQ